jgi:hypothetical protein
LLVILAPRRDGAQALIGQVRTASCALLEGNVGMTDRCSVNSSVRHAHGYDCEGSTRTTGIELDGVEWREVRKLRQPVDVKATGYGYVLVNR